MKNHFLWGVIASFLVIEPYLIGREFTNSIRSGIPEIVSAKDVSYSSEISHKVWGEVKPYLISDNNPLKERLDEICSGIRILESYDSLEKAGFNIIYKQLNRGLVVAKHPLLPGYLVKLYLDSCARSEWPLWVLRAKGARVIQGLLNKFNYNKFMKVPVKWIYPVPKKRRPKADSTTFPKDFILLVKDLDLCGPEDSLEKLNKAMTFSCLKALHKIICMGGLSDSHVGNVPFSKDGRIAFIDTEYVNVWPVHLDWLTKYFSAPNQTHWKSFGGGQIHKK